MKHRSRRATLLAAALATALRAAAAAEESSPYGPNEGVASWYGAQFQGRKTANGEIFDKEQLTCAHRFLPFGTFLLVRNLDNASSVVVRVNDRGPFAKNRILDLSESAARYVGMLATGTARVSFSILPPEEALAWKGGPLGGAPESAASRAANSMSHNASSTAAPTPDSAATAWRIQVASYRDEANARATVERLRAAGLSPVIERAGAYDRVVFPKLSEDESRTVSARLDRLGYRGYTVTASRLR